MKSKSFLWLEPPQDKPNEPDLSAFMLRLIPYYFQPFVDFSLIETVAIARRFTHDGRRTKNFRDLELHWGLSEIFIKSLLKTVKIRKIIYSVIILA